MKRNDLLYTEHDESMRNFLRLSSMSDGTNQAIMNMLETIGNHFDGDRSYLFEKDKGGQSISNTFEWCAPGVKPEIKNLQKVPIDAIKIWCNRYLETGSFLLTVDKKMEKTDPLAYKILEAQNITSLITAPLFSAGEFVGMIGVDNPRQNLDHLLLISVMATSLYNEIQHIRLKQMNVSAGVRSTNETTDERLKTIRSLIAAIEKEHNLLNLLNEHLKETVLTTYYEEIARQQDQCSGNSSMIIEALSRSYDSLLLLNLKEGTFQSIKKKVGPGRKRRKPMAQCESYEDMLESMLMTSVSPEDMQPMREFTDMSTINDRLKTKDVVSRRFLDIKGQPVEWMLFEAERSEDGTVGSVVLATHKVDEKLVLQNEKSRTQLLQNMGHEIRTPLNAMFGFSQLLGLPDGSWSEEEKKQYSSYIQNSYSMMDMLIGDILDVSDSEDGKIKVSISEVNVNEVCANALKSVEYRKPEQVKMYFTTDVDDTHRIKSDGRRIQQVLVNLLTNACKNTTKGEIHLHCSDKEKPGKITFSVTDTGKGIPADKADIIFIRYAKLNQLSEGSGLGLDICRRIAQSLGAELNLDKNYENGARFIFVVEDTD